MEYEKVKKRYQRARDSYCIARRRDLRQPSDLRLSSNCEDSGTFAFASVVTQRTPNTTETSDELHHVSSSLVSSGGSGERKMLGEAEGRF